uniref:Uncharacterized protein n=1 Tax=Rhizophora mucronata TaxID=61149 RepID=A0A2P2MXS5_RHIMU
MLTINDRKYKRASNGHDSQCERASKTCQIGCVCVMKFFGFLSCFEKFKSLRWGE